MGTNFYAHKIPSKKRKLELCNLINTCTDFNEIERQMSNTFGPISYSGDVVEGNYGRVHLGKRSGGWKFLWNPNVWKVYNGHTEKTENGSRWVEDPPTPIKIYELNKKSIKEFIDRPDIEIYDEYGDKQDKEEFWEMALNWTTWNGEEAWDSKTYELSPEGSKKAYRFTPDDQIKFLISLGYNIEWPWYDFYSDGLRFSTNNEFS